MTLAYYTNGDKMKRRSAAKAKMTLKSKSIRYKRR